MKIENPIGWCDETTNAATGCDKISEGCKNCYAQVGTRARVLRGQGIETWGPHGVRHPVKEYASKLLRLNQLCICDKCHATYQLPGNGSSRLCARPGGHCLCGGSLRRIRLFADSNSDWLDEKWFIPGKVDLLGEFLQIVLACRNVNTLLLTKRIENFRPRLQQVFAHYKQAPCNDSFCAKLENWLDGDAPDHVWLGCSGENQRRYDERAEIFKDIPAVVKFWSLEPLLERVDLRGLHSHWQWVIVGAESGADRRDCGLDALTHTIAGVIRTGLPVYVKQDCAFKSGEQGRLPDEFWRLKQFPKL